MKSVISKDGTIIAFERFDEGQPVIVVGAALQDRTTYSPLAKHFTVINYDRRGRGDSGDTSPYTVGREIEDIEALIEEAGGSALVFGHSSGGMLALRAAASGLEIPKLAVYEPPFLVDDSRPPLPEDYVEHLDELVATERRGDAVAYFMTKGAGVSEEFVDQMRSNDLYWPAFEAIAHTIPYEGRIMSDTMSGQPLSKEPWDSIEVPTLVMDGGASEPWIRKAAQQLAWRLPDSRHITLEGQDHGPADEILAPALVKFLSG